MFGIGPMELVVICVIALVFVGPKKLPDLMKQVGRLFVHARRYSSDIRAEFNEVVRNAESEIRMEEAQKMRDHIQAEIRKTQSQIKGAVMGDEGNRGSAHADPGSAQNPDDDHHVDEIYESGLQEGHNGDDNGDPPVEAPNPLTPQESQSYRPDPSPSKEVDFEDAEASQSPDKPKT